MYPIWLQFVLGIDVVMLEFICNLLLVIRNYVRALCAGCSTVALYNDLFLYSNVHVTFNSPQKPFEQWHPARDFTLTNFG